MEKQIKLHLGCGQKYMDGYINIDYPSSQHTIQKTSVADEFHNIHELTYKSSSVDEIRLHHVFEHFERMRACAFMAGWNSWLKIGGILDIEVPDFETTCRRNLSFFSKSKHEGVALRHIFGSQEAAWAVHFEGYSVARLTKLFTGFGFRVLEVKKTAYKRTFNVEVIGSKERNITYQQALVAAREYLSDYMVDHSETEKNILDVQCANFEAQLIVSFAC